MKQLGHTHEYCKSLYFGHKLLIGRRAHGGPTSSLNVSSQQHSVFDISNLGWDNAGHRRSFSSFRAEMTPHFSGQCLLLAGCQEAFRDLLSLHAASRGLLS
jgi:hypothetical protein